MEHKSYARAISGAHVQVPIRFETLDTALWSHSTLRSFAASRRVLDHCRAQCGDRLDLAVRTPAVREPLNFRRFARHPGPARVVLQAPAEDGMTDLLLVLATAAFFGLSWGYARLCEKL
jgi:hypothetical protein